MIKNECNITQHSPRHAELVSVSTHALNHKCCAMGHEEILNKFQNDESGGKS